ncbi:MAG: TonB-dependent receptor [bacterium]|nr:TonB-dependent receptor [bacterium]
MNRILLIVLAALLAAATAAPPKASRKRRRTGAGFMIVAGDTIWLTDPVLVFGTRVPAALPAGERDVTVLDAGEAALLPVRAPAELLAAAPGVAAGQRQLYGTQADLSIRGSTFEQVRVLLSGMDVGDPQTGHHALDLPLSLTDLARLEVLSGQGSVLAGAGAFGGVVNAVPRAPAAVRGGAAAVTAGGDETRGARLRLDAGRGDVLGLDAAGWLSGDWFRTDGDRPGTDAENLTVATRGTATAHGAEIDLLAGFARREFGALDFYAPFPSGERTETTFAGLIVRRPLSARAVIEQRLYGRRHEDRFVLFRDDPARYTNDHLNRRAASETRLSVDLGAGLTAAAGLDAGYEDLDSRGVRAGVAVAALGRHDRRHAAGALEMAWRRGAWRATAGLRRDAWSQQDPATTRTAALRWQIDPAVALRASAGSVLRIPTFTELYYEDPANRGDPHLQPEHGWAWDLGATVASGPWTLDWSVFERHEEDLIDWVRPASAPTQPWLARNVAKGRVRGWTQSYGLTTPRGDALALHHTIFEAERSLPPGDVAKYAMLVPRHLLAASATIPVERGVTLGVQARHRSRAGDRGHVIVDLRTTLTRGDWSLSADLVNAFDREYQEIPGVPLPGRLVAATCALAF